MIKIVLVDDNRTLIRALTTTIPWEVHGIEIAGVAYDGVEAQRLLTEDVSVLVTDVKMPRMDGIALTQYVAEHFPQIQVVFISAYKEFDYAISAMKLKVFDYIDKPINNEKLVQTVLRAFDAGRNRADRAALLKNALPFMREHLLRQQLMGRKVLQQLLLQTAFPSWTEHSWYTCVAFEAVLPENCSEVWVLKASAEKKMPDALCVVMSETAIAAVWADTEEPDQSAVDSYLLEVKAVLSQQKQQNIVCKAGISQSLQGVELLHRLYTQAQQALNLSDFWSEQAVYASPELIDSTPQISIQVKEALACGDGLANITDTQRLSMRLNDLRHHLENLHNPEVFQMTAVFVLNQYVREMLDSASDVEPLLKASMEAYRKTSRGLQPIAIDVLCDFITQQSKSRVALVSKKKERIIRQIYDAIDRVGFSDDGGLQRISQEVYLSPSYVSMLFKQETGMSISAYQNQKRLERAKKLLKDPNLKVYEIASMVGYVNQYYFSVWFKRGTGCTPSEYREKV